MNQRAKDIIVVSLLFCAALFLRLFLLKYKVCIENDGVAYVAIARGLVEQHALTNHLFPPFYPFLIGMASLFTGNYELAARLVSAVCGSLLVFPVFVLAREIYGSRTAWFTAILLAVYPPLVEYSLFALTESTYLLFFCLLLLSCYYSFRTGRMLFFVITGLLDGICYLIRPEAVAYLPYVLVCYAAFCVWGRNVGKAVFLRNALVFAAGALVLMVPYMTYVGGMSGKTQMNLAIGEVVGHADFRRGADETLQNGGNKGNSSLAGELLQHPVKMGKRWVMNAHLVQKYVIPVLFPGLILVLVAFGLTRIMLRCEDLLILVSCVPLAGILFFFVDARFFLPVVPGALILSARGIEYIEDKAAVVLRASGRGVLGMALLAGVIISMLPFALRPLYRPDENITYRDAGIWLRANVRVPIKILDRKPWVSFYANAELLPCPVGSWPQVLQFAVSNGATHIVIDDRYIPEARKELAFLQYPEYAPPDVKLVHQFLTPDAARVLVYEFRK